MRRKPTLSEFTEFIITVEENANIYMTKYLLLVSFLISLSGLAQSREGHNIDLRVSYELIYKNYVDSDKIGSEHAILLAENGSSLFTFENMMSIDSIQQFRTLNIADISLYRVPLYYLIKRDENSIVHYEALGNDLFRFNESVDLNWRLVNEEKVISGYTCKKATLNYAGRDWVAWYATEIPVNAGPYKFYGLPGLIIDISDTDQDYNFTAYEIKTGDFNIKSDVRDFFMVEGNEPSQEIEKLKFYQLREKYYKMTLNERLQYMNRAKEGKHSFIVTDLNGEKVRMDRNRKTRNFIEQSE